MQESDRRDMTPRTALMQFLQCLPDERERFTRALEAFSHRRSLADWNELVAIASYHGVLSVLDWRSLPDDVEIPRQARDAAQQRVAVQHVWHSHLMSGLRTAVAALND